MNGRGFGIAILLSLSVNADGRFSAQDPSATAPFQPKAGQAVFLVSVRGDCGRAGATAIVNGMEVLLPFSQPAADERQTLDRAIPIRQPSNRAVPDTILWKEAEGELKKKFRMVDSADKADFVLHVCGRYLFDVAPHFQAVGAGRPDQRVAVRALAVTPKSFQQASGSYQQLWSAAWWKYDTAEGPPRGGASVRLLPMRPGSEGKGVVIGGGRRVDGDVSAKEVFKGFVEDVTKGRIRTVKAADGAIASGGANPATPSPPSPAPAPTAPPLSVAQPAAADQSAVEAGETMSIETALVSIPVIVTDPNGKYVPGLSKGDFRVLEDGVEQQVEEFATTEEPFNIVLMIDSSGSTRFKLEEIQNAAIAFVEQARPQDSVMVVSFDSRVWIDSEFTNDRERVRAAIRKTRTGMATRLYDALYLVLTERLRDMGGRKAIVLFSDGVDQGSRISDPDGALERAERQNAFVYTVQYEPSLPTTGFRAKADMEQAKLFMKEAAMRTGGGYYEAAGINDINQAFGLVAGELRQQYLLGYYPTNAKRDGRYRQIKVIVNRPEVKIRAREGYQAVGVRRDK